ncbi:MAG: DinB family protein, partial [Anaerolineae bacterium]|nr:DinB family protein [Anaerolineae bacterium]
MNVGVQTNTHTPDRAAIRAELESVQAAFHQLVDSLSDSDWHRKSPSSDWTMGEVLVHLTWSLEYLPHEVAQAALGKGMFNIPKAIADPASLFYVRWLARKANRASIVQRYDAAIAAAIAALHTVCDEDWAKGAKFYGEGFYSIEDLFHTPLDHFKEHSAGIVV